VYFKPILARLQWGCSAAKRVVGEITIEEYHSGFENADGLTVDLNAWTGLSSERWRETVAAPDVDQNVKGLPLKGLGGICSRQ